MPPDPIDGEGSNQSSMESRRSSWRGSTATSCTSKDSSFTSYPRPLVCDDFCTSPLPIGDVHDAGLYAEVAIPLFGEKKEIKSTEQTSGLLSMIVKGSQA